MNGNGANLEFRPSYKEATIEFTLNALLLAFATALLCYFTGKSIWFSASAALVAGTVAFALYFGRFVRKASIGVRLCDDGLTIVYRSKEDCISWAEVRNAYHESDYGLQWRLVHQARTLVIRDEGFSATHWDELSKAMYAKLEAHFITVETVGFAAIFVCDDSRR